MNPTNIGTRDVPLHLAKAITDKVNAAFAGGSFIEKATPVTQDLLKFWFMPPYTENRSINFHPGQRQSILNTIYLHEIIGLKSVKDIYLFASSDLLKTIVAAELAKDKYNIPMYAINMATGTGKTGVMHALLIWQMLNAKYETTRSDKFTKNFLLVAPGIIVYERLLDAYLGKENEKQERVFEQSDFYKFNELFIAPSYKDDVYGFIQNNVARKEEIGSKVTGDGLIAITNWHLFMSENGEEIIDNSPLDNTAAIVQDLLPLTPGVSGGNVLNNLDNAYLRGKELDYLISLPDLLVINDEAHHIHDNKNYGEIEEVEWQKGLNKIAENKSTRFIQIDFSATPYDVTGSGQNRTKHFFPHIISVFDLGAAIRGGYVKTIAIDKRKEITDLPLDFSAIRDGDRKVIGLSEGQRLMLRAGITKLNLLEREFIEFQHDETGKSNKYPKMLVMCEDTTVSPVVEEFLIQEGIPSDNITRIDTNRSGDVPEKEWKDIKQRLFNIDQYDKPKVIISVLMLREGFDVNNICVIVPLRSSTSLILIEQTIGRGLRLMWREPVYEDIKRENRRLLLEQKKEPITYIDLLTIIEHPAFIQFYNELLKDNLLGEIEDNPDTPEKVLGDLITVGLKEDYKQYDIFWPVVIQDSEETIKNSDFSVDTLIPYTQSSTHFTLEQLKAVYAKDGGEVFHSQEITVGTNFGEYVVSANLFNAANFNEYLQHLLETVTHRIAIIGNRKKKTFPVLQINQVQIIQLLDQYIRVRLFGEPFDPFEGENWKILLAKNGIVTQHIVQQIGTLLYEMQQNVDVSDAIVEKHWFSSIDSIKMRKKYSLDIVKTIYEKLAYPSNKGEFEKAFMEFADNEGTVDALIKVNEHQDTFASITYFRSDGLISSYHPDFIIVTKDKVYVIETKGQDRIDTGNVLQKQRSTINWCNKINKLNEEDRMNRIWEYILLSDTHFYTYQKNGANLTEICNLAKVSVSEANVKGKLF